MSSKTFFKLTTLFSTFIFLSGVAMEPEKRSTEDICNEITIQMDSYSENYKLDLTELIHLIKASNFAHAVSILEQIANNIQNYTQEDTNNFLLLVQSYRQDLYKNELIGLAPFGTLANHKSILRHIKVACLQKLDAKNEPVKQDATEPKITKKSRFSKKASINEPIIEEKQNLESVDSFALGIQTDINTIAHARIFGDLQQKNVPIDISSEQLNSAMHTWTMELLKALDKAREKKSRKGCKEAVTHLWQANFNNNHAHFKAREERLYTLIIETLEENKAATHEIEWFRSCISKLVYKKEIHPTLKSNAKKQKDEPTKKSTTTKTAAPKAAPKANPLAQKVNTVLARLNSATEHDAIMKILDELPAILEREDASTLKEADKINVKFDIDESVLRIYKSCILGLYGKSEQKLQLHIFETCADKLIAFGTYLRTQLKESNKEVNTYADKANKQKDNNLYTIKVIRDSEKIAHENDIKQWKTIVQDQLASQVGGQNLPGIEKTIQANFNADKTPHLAEEYENIVPDIYEQKNMGKTWPKWLKKNKKSFRKPNGAGVQNGPGGADEQPQMPFHSFYKTCKDHWVLSSLALSAVIAGIYYIWEECTTEDESEEDQGKADKKEEPADTTQEGKENTGEQAKTA